jgi:ADP-ribosylglycohydrolase
MAEVANHVSGSGEITDANHLHALAKGAMRDKIYGCLVGSAVGDCIGLYTEFMDKRTARKQYPERNFRLTDPVTPLLLDRHRARFGTNVWTDDTDQALSILLGYLHNGIHDAKDFAARLHIWVNQGLRALQTWPLGLGETVANAVMNPIFLEHPVKASYAAWKVGDYFGAANGSLMRCHPLGATCVFKPLSETFSITTEYGLVTHPNPKCIVSCCIVVGLIRGFLLAEITKESQIDAMINKAVRWTDQWDDKRRRRISEVDKKDARLQEEPRLDHAELMRHVSADIENLEELDLDEKDKIGYVYKSLGATIFLVRSAIRQLTDLDFSEVTNLKQSGKLFEQLVTDLVMEAGDADTNACSAAAVLGAYLGYQGVPQYWRDGLKYGDFLKHKTEGLCQTLGISVGDYDGTTDVQTFRDGGNGFLGDYEQRYFPFANTPASKNTKKGTTSTPATSSRAKRPSDQVQTGPKKRV